MSFYPKHCQGLMNFSKTIKNECNKTLPRRIYCIVHVMPISNFNVLGGVFCALYVRCAVLFKKIFEQKVLSIALAALGIGILAALILPFWFLVACEAILLVLLGLCCLK